MKPTRTMFRNTSSDFHDFERLGAALAGGEFKLDGVALFERLESLADDFRVVDEDIRGAAGRIGDEAEALLVVEPFDDSLGHKNGLIFLSWVRLPALWSSSGGASNAYWKNAPPRACSAPVKKESAKPLVGVVMGSKSDWPVLKSASDVLGRLGVAHECRVVSAHRTPDLMARYAKEARGRGLRAIIAGAGGAAHLPGMLAAQTTVPVLGVPVPSGALQGMDALLSIVQMPGGIPVATFSIGVAGAKNAALFAAALLAGKDAALARRLEDFRAAQSREALDSVLPPA